MGEKTSLTIASTKSESLRTTVPRGIVKHFNLVPGDILDWIIDIKDNKMVIFVKPIHKK